MASNNYWCKFCSTYVRDTKFEKQQHEATGRHKGSVQRALRNIHRDHERGERDKARAKSEVARLNGLVGPKTDSSSATAAGDNTARTVKSSTAARATTAAPPLSQQANPQERKRQMAQLAAMGVAVPEEFRREMAMAGDWEVTRVLKTTTGGSRGDVDDDDDDVKGEAGRFGVKRRKVDDAEDDGAEEAVANHEWGRRTREYPTDVAAVADFDALLAGSSSVVKKEPSSGEQEKTEIKKEEDDNGDESKDAKTELPSAAAEAAGVKQENEEVMAAPVVFKKRKSKATPKG